MWTGCGASFSDADLLAPPPIASMAKVLCNPPLRACMPCAHAAAVAILRVRAGEWSGFAICIPRVWERTVRIALIAALCSVRAVACALPWQLATGVRLRLQSQLRYQSRVTFSRSIMSVDAPSLAFCVLHACPQVKGSPPNAMQLSKYIPFMQSQLPYGFRVADTLMEIFKDNRGLLEEMNEEVLTCFVRCDIAVEVW